MEIEAVTQFLSGLLTPVVAVTTAYIAYRQYRIEHLKAKESLYDRRFHVYKETLRFVWAASRSEGFGSSKIAEFRQVRAEAEFLFGADVMRVLDVIWNRGVEIHVNEEQRLRTPVEEELPALYRIRDHQQWFSEADKHVTAAFRSYLTLL